MADTSFGITPGSGANLHVVSTSIGGTTVQDQVVKLGPPYLATYTVGVPGISVATADAHLMQLMAGATLPVYVTRIRLYQVVAATTATLGRIDIHRVTTAGTGGGAQTEAAHDESDAASGAVATTLPTAKGTEGARLYAATVGYMQTMPTAGFDALLLDIDFPHEMGKPLRISAGTSNGLVVKGVTAVAAATVAVNITYFEANF